MGSHLMRQLAELVRLSIHCGIACTAEPHSLATSFLHGEWNPIVATSMLYRIPHIRVYFALQPIHAYTILQAQQQLEPTSRETPYCSSPSQHCCCCWIWSLTRRLCARLSSDRSLSVGRVYHRTDTGQRSLLPSILQCDSFKEQHRLCDLRFPLSASRHPGTRHLQGSGSTFDRRRTWLLTMTDSKILVLQLLLQQLLLRPLTISPPH